MRDVVTGQGVTPTCGDSRTESDFVAHIQQTVESDLDATKWHFIVDCLNIHQSESLVRFVSQFEGLEIDLGIKGETGILKSMKTRAAFLSDPTHRTSFTTPPSTPLGSIRLKSGSAFYSGNCSSALASQVLMT
jgi:putative transposase